MHAYELEPPVLLVDVEVETGRVRLPDDRDPTRYGWALAYLRRDGVPVDTAVLALRDGTPDPGAVAAACAAATSSPSSPSSEAEPPAVRRPSPRHDVRVSVVISTVDRPRLVQQAVHSIAAGSQPLQEILVVDNSRDGRNAGLLAELASKVPSVRPVAVPQPGLSRARNAAAALATGDVLAFTDDDVLAEPDWAAALVCALAEAEVATGLILPRELETPAQMWSLRAGGHGKGFRARTFQLGAAGMPPLFPYQVGAYGSGASIACRRRSYTLLAGFDEALGPGTRAVGGEDLDLLLRAVLRGLRVRYTPAAVVRHHDPPDAGDFARQRYGYGHGLSAVLVKHLLDGHAWPMARRAGPALRHLLAPGSEKNGGKAGGYPLHLTVRELAGLARGVTSYRRPVGQPAGVGAAVR